MYWDGQQWHRNTLVATQPAGAPSQGDAITLQLDEARPQVHRARRIWSGLPHQRQVILAIAVLLVAVAAVAAQFAAFDCFLGGPDKSPSYQEGYASGSSGVTRIAAIGLGEDTAGRSDLAKAQLLNLSLNAEDDAQGCLDGLRDHRSPFWHGG